MSNEIRQNYYVNGNEASEENNSEVVDQSNVETHQSGLRTEDVEDRQVW